MNYPFNPPIRRAYNTSFNIKHNFFRNFSGPFENPISNFHNTSGIKLITRLRLGFSNLHEHKSRHNFQNTLNPICSCRENIETATQYLLYCSNYLNGRMAPLSNIQNVEENCLDRKYFWFSEVLHFGDSSFNKAKNRYFKCCHSRYIWY